jgi:putative transcriptional regulator
MRAAAQTTGEDGLFLVYYAGHGFPHGDDLVLGLRGVDPAHPDEDGLRYVKVREATQHAMTLRRIVILDCCFAGRAGRDVLDAGDAVKQIVNRAEIQTEKTGLLVAVGPNELAKAPLDARNTAFTSALLRVFRAGSDASDPLLTVRTVADEVIRQVVAAGHLRPEFRESNSAGDLPFVRNIRIHPTELTGAVLESSAELTDPELRQATILILRHNQTGAIGVRLNRTLGPLPSSLEGWRVSPPSHLFDGGPVARDGFIALVRLLSGEEPPIRFTEVVDLIGSLPLSDSQPDVRNRIADLRVFRGYLGWGPGDLERLVEARLLRRRAGAPSRTVFANDSFDRTSL